LHTPAQNTLIAQQDNDLKDFRRITTSDVAELRRNFTAMLREELVARKAYLKEHFDALTKKVEDGYKEPDEEVDKDVTGVNALTRKQGDRLTNAVDKLNTLETGTKRWGSSMLQTLASLGRQLGRAKSATDNSRSNIATRVRQTKDRLESLLQAAQQLADLRAKLAEVVARAGEVTTKESSDYATASAQATDVEEKVGNWRGQLEDALAELRTAVTEEEDKRIADHNNATAGKLSLIPAM
jgi:ABC-type transporter Mla subunit MlaD